MFRKGPRVSRRLCGFRRGRPFSGSVENPSFFSFFLQPTPPPPKTKATFFLLSAPLEPSIEVARSPVDPESTVKNIPSNEGNEGSAARQRQLEGGPKGQGPADFRTTSSGRPSRVFFFFLGGGDPAPRSVGAVGGLQVFYDGWRGRAKATGAASRGAARTVQNHSMCPSPDERRMQLAAAGR